MSMPNEHGEIPCEETMYSTNCTIYSESWNQMKFGILPAIPFSIDTRNVVPGTRCFEVTVGINSAMSKIGSQDRSNKVGVQETIHLFVDMFYVFLWMIVYDRLIFGPDDCGCTVVEAIDDVFVYQFSKL